MFLTPPFDIVIRPWPLTRASMVALAFLAPFVFYFGTAQSIVALWNSSETFAHGYIILPISLWLIWRRRAVFGANLPTPCWPALALLLLLGAAWLLARMGQVQVVMQYAFVAMIPAIALAILGRQLAGELTFPLLFLLFAVPFGQVFIDPLIAFTADFTVWALQMTGIPVLRNGAHFEIPSGSWSVVEACSGVRYLISSVTLGCLYAYLTYSSSLRRALFILMAIVVPIVANGLRAYMIVMIGHLSSMTMAVGVDHLIYGWLFFGLVMFLMFWIGSFWREEHDLPITVQFRAAAVSGRIGTMAFALVASVAIWPAFALYNDRTTHNPNPVRLGNIDLAWVPAAPFSAWTPRFAPADATFDGTFQPGFGAAVPPVALSLRYYRNQSNGKVLISSTNVLVGEKDPLHQVRAARRNETIGARTLALREASLEGSSGAILVWHWYWIDRQFIGNDYVGKLMQAKAKLLFRSDDGAALLVSAPYAGDAEVARTAMRAFLGANLGAIEAALLAARGQP